MRAKLCVELTKVQITHQVNDDSNELVLGHILEISLPLSVQRDSSVNVVIGNPIGIETGPESMLKGNIAAFTYKILDSPDKYFFVEHS